MLYVSHTVDKVREKVVDEVPAKIIVCSGVEFVGDSHRVTGDQKLHVELSIIQFTGTH